MSWLSKLVGGKTLKIAAIAAAGYAGKQYLFGSSSGHGYDISTGSYIAPKFTGDNFAASTFNRLGVTPFSNTSFGQSGLGQAITKTGSFLGLGESGGAATLAGVVDSLTASQRFDKMPSPGTIQASGVNSDTNFQPGQVGRIPIGNNGQVGNALNSEAMRQYLAKQVAMMALPPVQNLPSVDMSGSTLEATTSQRRRSYKSVTGGQ